MQPRLVLPILAVLAVAAPASARLAPGPVSAQNQPVPTAGPANNPTTAPTNKAKLKEPRYTLQIQFVRTADDDGGRPSKLTRTQANQAIARANEVYRRNGGDVAFVMHPASDFDDLIESTALNRDCIFAAGQTTATIEANTDHSVDPNTLCDSVTPSNARTAYGLERADRIVVFSRGGNFAVEWDGNGGHWHVKRPSGGQSWGTQSYVRMPDDFNGSTLLAHELGHYLHNPHTFNDDDSADVATIADAKRVMEAWVAEHPDDHPSAVFDGDARSGYVVNDTPPDPRGSVLIAGHKGATKCDLDRGSVTVAIRVNGATQNVTLTPDRSNVMSYFKGCDNFPQHFSDDQYKNIHAALAGNRRDLLGSDEGGCYSNGSGGAVVTTESGLIDSIRKVAACKLLVKKPMPWEEVMGTIYSQPGDLKPGFTKIGGIGVHRVREKALLRALRTAPVED